MKFNKKLCIITHVPHWISEDGSINAYEPYVREIEIWATLFSEIEVCAPRSTGKPSGHQAALNCKNISWVPFEYFQENGNFAWIKRLLQLPKMVAVLYSSIIRNDLIHLRSPGHPALMGQVLVRLLNKKSITKWAGFYGSFSGERLTSKVERFLVKNAGSRHIVLIYGKTNKENEISFFPALMSEMELSTAKNYSSQKAWRLPWHILSVGRITPVKGFDLAIRGLGYLNKNYPNLDWDYTLVGDGIDLEKMRTLVTNLGISDRVTFTGYLPFSKVQNLYAQAHLVIMPGIKEGWPKVIVEAWAHGALPVCASAGLVPQILQDPQSGFLFEPDPCKLAETLEKIMTEDIKTFQQKSAYVLSLATKYSLDYFKYFLSKILIDYFPFLQDEQNANN